MNTSTDYLDAVKLKTGAASDYAVAKQLSVTKQTISRWRKKEDFLSDQSAIKVAEILGIDSGIVIAAVHAERAKNETEKAAWTSIFEKLGGLAAGVVMGLAVATPAPVQAAENASVYIMLNDWYGGF